MSSLIPVRVFVSSPGDLKPERLAVNVVLGNLTNAYKGLYQFDPYIYESVVPPRVGMSAQEVVDSYMLQPNEADIFICMFWIRMGTPTLSLIDPDTKQPYHSGTEYEFMTAYRNSQLQKRPIILLYRCTRPPDDITQVDAPQLEQVNTFFKRFGKGGNLEGMNTGSFKDTATFSKMLSKDIESIMSHDSSVFTFAMSINTKDRIFLVPNLLPRGYVERTGALDTLKRALLGSKKTIGLVAATALYGEGGIGKTVLARAVCDDPGIKSAFADGVLWANLGQRINDDDILRWQRQWIVALGSNANTFMTTNSAKAELDRLASNKRLLFVIDDVWNEHDALPLLINGEGCRTLVTTRFREVVPEAEVVSLSQMQDREGQQVLLNASENADLSEGLLEAITERLGHVALALQLAGGMLADGIAWETIAQRLGRSQDETEAEKHLIVARMTRISIDLLPENDSIAYQQLVIFPEDIPLIPSVVTRYWGYTCGFTTEKVQYLLDRLTRRGLLQTNLTLHDLHLELLRRDVPSIQQQQWHSLMADEYSLTTKWALMPTDDELYG